MMLPVPSIRFAQLQTLFLCSLFLYPFNAAEHTLYMIPQLLLLATGLVLLSRSAMPSDALMKAGICALALVASAIALFGEALAGEPAFLEPVKLLINLATVVLFLSLAPAFDSTSCAKWLKRFAMIWLLIVIGAYVYARTSTWEMLLLLFEPEGVTSTRLYEIAEPLAPIFLTKNIVAMYVVAVFGAFLYFRRSAGLAVSIVEKTLFVFLIVILFSRQAILASAVVLFLDYFLIRKKKLSLGFLVAIGIAVVAVGGILALAVDFSSPDDGASTRLDLWRAFLAHWASFGFTGLGVHQLNASLEYLDIDNYHMFFMNQIAAYGIVHCVAFNLLLTLIALRTLPKKSRWLLIAPYWLNVCFQTYGYEYGNLFLFCIAANNYGFRLEQLLPEEPLVPGGQLSGALAGY
jgi:hypothetical protein